VLVVSYLMVVLCLLLQVRVLPSQLLNHLLQTGPLLLLVLELSLPPSAYGRRAADVCGARLGRERERLVSICREIHSINMFKDTKAIYIFN